MPDIITISHLNKSFGAFKALDQLDLKVDRGTIFGLLGANGAGKTTLVSILNGLTGFDSGKIEILGRPLPGEIAFIRRHSTLIPQSLAFYGNLSVIENLRFFAGLQGLTGDLLRRNLDYAVSVNRLENLLEQRAATLSGGQQRRLNIAVGLLNDPELLYFDEPTVGIDPEARIQILDTIRACRDEAKTVIYTSHYMPEIENLCDEIAIIDRGRILRQGKLTTLLQEEASDSAVMKLFPTAKRRLAQIAGQEPAIEVIDTETLFIARAESRIIGHLLDWLEKEKITVKEIRYGTTNLETLYLRLTGGAGSGTGNA